MQPRHIVITSGLLYANGALHLGHILETIQADIWARFQRLRGHRCDYFCGDDAHGTPIMLHAERQGVTPEALITTMHQEHKADLAAFLIDFTNYYTTHSPENQQLVETFYTRLLARGDISSQTIAQAYDPVKEMFLPDRYVKGNCPRCAACDQYGDNCEACGATYSPSELNNPVSVISGVTPVYKESTHYFFELPHYRDFLQEWMQHNTLQPEMRNKLEEWFNAGLKAWDISRDAPYFGFPIPGVPNKYFYVWLDAPIGYMASHQHACARDPDLDFTGTWAPGSHTEVYHFIGKDIVYFHALFWPALLRGAGFRTPTALFAHGFLTINGHKMSKSRGTFIKAQTYLQHLNPEYLRYYFAAKLTPHVSDIDLQFDDFKNRNNADLVGKVINIASRCAKFINQSFANRLASTLHSTALLDHFITTGEPIAQAFETRDFAEATRHIMALADQANQYIDQEKPWLSIKHDAAHAHAVCSTGLHLFRVLMTYLKAILPATAAASERFLQCAPLTWDNRAEQLLDHEITLFTPLLTRIEEQHMLDLQHAAQSENQPTPSPRAEPIKDNISVDDFAKVDLRVVEIIHAEYVEGADKLLKLTVDLGHGETRHVFAGIRHAYQPDALIGRKTVLVANLEPRKMRFGVSEGMILAAGPGGNELWLLQPDQGALPGMRIK